MERVYRDREHFNEIMLNGSDKDILKILVTSKTDGQGYPILRDILNYRNTQKLVKTTMVACHRYLGFGYRNFHSFFYSEIAQIYRKFLAQRVHKHKGWRC